MTRRLFFAFRSVVFCGGENFRGKHGTFILKVAAAPGRGGLKLVPAKILSFYAFTLLIMLVVDVDVVVRDWYKSRVHHEDTRVTELMTNEAVFSCLSHLLCLWPRNLHHNFHNSIPVTGHH